MQFGEGKNSFRRYVPIEEKIISGNVCIRGHICRVKVKLHALNASRDPVLFAKIKGPSTLLAATEIKLCPEEEVEEQEEARTGIEQFNPKQYCVIFQAMEPGVHFVEVRLEYNSKSEALRNYKADNHANLCFLGKSILKKNVTVVAKSGQQSEECAAASLSPVGYWMMSNSHADERSTTTVRTGVKRGGESGTNSIIFDFECGSFFSPLAVVESLREYYYYHYLKSEPTNEEEISRNEEAVLATVLPSLKQAHVALLKGVPLWDLRTQSEAILNLTKSRLSSSQSPFSSLSVSTLQTLTESWLMGKRHQQQPQQDDNVHRSTSRWMWVPPDQSSSIADSLPRSNKKINHNNNKKNNDDRDDDKGIHHPSCSLQQLETIIRGGNLNVEECLADLSPITFAVDSVGRYIYHYLVCAMRYRFVDGGTGRARSEDGHVELNFSPAHGISLPNNPPQVTDIVENYISSNHPHAKRVEGHNGDISATTKTLIVNPGLWDVAYGDLDVYRREFGRLLELVRHGIERKSSPLEMAVFLSTTEVHPVLYSALSKDPRKQYMTKPRVELVNSIQRAAIYFPSSSSSSSSSGGIKLVDLWNMTRVREDDPLERRDMRHYGASTVREMAIQLLHSICNR